MNKEKYTQGQSLVEFALILLVALPLILGFLDLGRAVLYYSSLSNAVREATRSAIVMSYTGYYNDENDPTVKTNIDNTLKEKVLEFAFALTGTSNPLTADDISVNVIYDDEYNRYKKINITGTYSFDPITPFIEKLFGSGNEIVLNVQSEMELSPGSWN